MTERSKQPENVLRAALSKAAQDGRKVTIYLATGIRLRGIIEAFDAEAVAFKDSRRGKRLVIRLAQVASVELPTNGGTA